MTSKEWKKRIDQSLAEKVNEALKSFEVQKEKDLSILVQLSEQLHDLKVKKEVAESQQKEEREHFIPSNVILNQLSSKVFHTGKSMAGIQKQIDFLFKKLTTIPESVLNIYPLIKILS